MEMLLRLEFGFKIYRLLVSIFCPFHQHTVVIGSTNEYTLFHLFVIGDSVYYTLRLKNTFDTAFKTEQYRNPRGEKDGYIKNAMGGDCGTPGLLAGN